MAEQTVLVCDECGTPAVETVAMRFGRSTRKLEKDLCQRHLTGYRTGAHRPKPGPKQAVIIGSSVHRGRAPKSADDAPKRRGRPPGSKNKKTLAAVA